MSYSCLSCITAQQVTTFSVNSAKFYPRCTHCTRLMAPSANLGKLVLGSFHDASIVGPEECTCLDSKGHSSFTHSLSVSLSLLSLSLPLLLPCLSIFFFKPDVYISTSSSSLFSPSSFSSLLVFPFINGCQIILPGCPGPITPTSCNCNSAKVRSLRFGTLLPHAAYFFDDPSTELSFWINEKY